MLNTLNVGRKLTNYEELDSSAPEGFYFPKCIYKHWISFSDNKINLMSRKIAASHPLGGYNSFNLYNMQPAFYLLLLGLCLSVLCFMVELLYNFVLNKRMRTW